MKRFLFALAGLAMLSAASSASAGSPIEGRWKNGPMEVVIAQCGSALCGTVVKASAQQKAKADRGSGTDLVGARLIERIEPTGPSTYRARVFVADQGVHANGTIRQVSRDQLKVRGCVLGIICKSKTWDRVR